MKVPNSFVDSLKTSMLVPGEAVPRSRLIRNLCATVAAGRWRDDFEEGLVAGLASGFEI